MSKPKNSQGAGLPRRRYNKKLLSNEDSTRPLIGIISKREHATSMLKRLTEAGAEVTLLGADKTVRISPRIPTVILRTASCSHGASEVATKWWRADKEHRSLLFNNSAEQTDRKSVV